MLSQWPPPTDSTARASPGQHHLPRPTQLRPTFRFSSSPLSSPELSPRASPSHLGCPNLAPSALTAVTGRSTITDTLRLPRADSAPRSARDLQHEVNRRPNSQGNLQMPEILLAAEAARAGSTPGPNGRPSGTLQATPRAVDHSESLQAQRQSPIPVGFTRKKSDHPQHLVRTRPTFGILYHTPRVEPGPQTTIAPSKDPRESKRDFWVSCKDPANKAAAIVYFFPEQLYIKQDFHGKGLRHWKPLDPPPGKGFVHRIPPIGWRILEFETRGRRLLGTPNSAGRLFERYGFLWDIANVCFSGVREHKYLELDVDLWIDHMARKEVKLAQQASHIPSASAITAYSQLLDTCRNAAQTSPEVNHIVVPACANRDLWQVAYEKWMVKDITIRELVHTYLDTFNLHPIAHAKLHTEIMFVARRILVAVIAPIRAVEVFRFLEAAADGANPSFGQILKDHFGIISSAFPGKLLLDEGEDYTQWSCSAYETRAIAISHLPVCPPTASAASSGRAATPASKRSEVTTLACTTSTGTGLTERSSLLHVIPALTSATNGSAVSLAPLCSPIVVRPESSPHTSYPWVFAVPDPATTASPEPKRIPIVGWPGPSSSAKVMQHPPTPPCAAWTPAAKRIPIVGWSGPSHPAQDTPAHQSMNIGIRGTPTMGGNEAGWSCPTLLIQDTPSLTPDHSTQGNARRGGTGVGFAPYGMPSGSQNIVTPHHHGGSHMRNAWIGKENMPPPTAGRTPAGPSPIAPLSAKRSIPTSAARSSAQSAGPSKRKAESPPPPIAKRTLNATQQPAPNATATVTVPTSTDASQQATGADRLRLLALGRTSTPSDYAYDAYEKLGTPFTPSVAFRAGTGVYGAGGGGESSRAGGLEGRR